MTTFFTILFIIIAVNAVMMFLSLNGVGQKKKPTTDGSKRIASEIYPIDLMSSDYKKAV